MFQPRTTHASLEQAETLRKAVSDLFVCANTTIDSPTTGHIRFRGFFQCDLAQCYDTLRARFEEHGFTPFIRNEDGEPSLIAAPIIFNPPPSNWVINLLLFLATVLSTLLVGATYELGETAEPAASAAEFYRDVLGNLHLGLPFSLAIVLILGAHELGHYFAARYHKVPVTLPYFIPLPFSLIGTMGAVIRLKAPIKNRRALLDIGAAGPLAGLVFALPILIIGLATSDVGPLPASGYYLEGNSILYSLLKRVILGQFLPAGGLDVSLNQLAWAGWVGLLVTGLNLIPLGQLDGGHMAYVLLGQRARRFFWPAMLAMGALAVITGAATWAVWLILLFLLGRTYAVPLDDVTDLDPGRRAIAVAGLVIFVLVFVPIPLKLVG